MAEKNFKWGNEADKREAELDHRLRELAGAGNWDGVLAELDRYDGNNERRHEEHRADLDPTVMEREPKPEELRVQRPGDWRKLCRWEEWDDVIFSQPPEDIHQLVAEYPTSAALKELSDLQRLVLWENVVSQVSTKEIAEELGCSVRNVTKLRKRAIEKVRLLVTGCKDL